MKSLFTILFSAFLISFCPNVFAQLEVGDIAPDWTFDDLDGNEYNLYSMLDEGKTVIIDASATWCYPCWQYHTSGELESVYEELGPEGTDEIRIFLID